MIGENTYLAQLQHAIGLTSNEVHVPACEQEAVNNLHSLQGTTVLITNNKILLARAMMRQQQQLLTLDKVWQALEAEGVRPVLLKGVGLARLYPEPYKRVSSDVDLWVGKGQYDKVTAILKRELDVEWHHESEEVNERHYNFETKQGLIFEIHPQTIPFILPKEKAALEAIELPAMTNAEEFEFEGHHFRMPQASFNLLFVFMHAWEHFISSGVGMKHLADLAILVACGKCDRRDVDDVLYSQLSALHLDEPWLVTGYVVVKAFGLKKEQWPGYKDSQRIRRLGERLYERIMREGLTRHQTSNTKHKKLNKWIGKAWTLCERIRTAMMIAPYSPKYARHYLYCAVYKGIKRVNDELNSHAE